MLRGLYAILSIVAVAPGCNRPTDSAEREPAAPVAAAEPVEVLSLESAPEAAAAASVRVDRLDLGDAYDFRRDKLTRVSSAFSTDTEVVYAVAALEGVGAPGDVAGRWVHLDSDTHLAARQVRQSGPQVVARFSLTRPTSGWPAGRYKFYLSVNGEDVSGSEFVVTAPAGAEAEQARED